MTRRPVSVRIGEQFRANRMQMFLERSGAGPRTRVVDVGGNRAIWQSVPESRRPQVTFVNLPRAFEPGDEGTRLVFADGTRLPFADASFDIAFSNSVIEHVGGPAAQRAFADEIRRVARAYWVQTPNRRFPVEQHLLTPVVHWLPRGLQRRVVPAANVWKFVANPDRDQASFYYSHYLNDIRLLTASGMRDLFPDAHLLRERFAGLTKSLIAWRAAVD